MAKSTLIETIENEFGIDYIGFLQEIDEPANYMGSRFLPAKNEFDYDWVYHIFDNTVAMAKLMSRGDAEAPVIGGPAVKKVAGSVAPFGQKFDVNKNILNKIFNPRNDNELKSNLRQILDESARNVRSAQARREWLRFQVCGKGSVTIANDDDDTVLTVDFGVPSGHKIASSALEGDEWDSSNTPKPLSDIIAACETFYDTNKMMPDAIVMRRAQLKQLTGSNEVATEFSDNATRISLSIINDYLISLGYPTIETYDEFVRTLDSDGRPTTSEYLVPAGRILFLKEAAGQEIEDTGRLIMGPVAENDFQPGIFTNIYEETDPKKYWHFMKTEMWPAVYNPEYVLYMDVLE